MENFEYSKVFPPKSAEANQLAPGESETIENLFNSYESAVRTNPHFLIPRAPAIFEKTVADCEQIAKEFSGRIKARIDFSHFTATIELWCCYVEFERGEFMSVLHEISLLAKYVRFTPLTSGDLHIEIEMPYFVSATVLEDTD